ncbi:MAG: ABC transporter transmembrane region 2-domain-containing protein [Monoraphidium minutum]|nr:MAG: ABC transporter transmembrane region 2-domain-containing protein [Monoraphidium minutum]
MAPSAALAPMYMTPGQKRALAVLLLAGGTAGGRALRTMVRAARAEQRQLCADSISMRARGGRATAKVAVDGVFFRRLLTILHICVPSPLSKEALLVLLQGGLLVSRTLLTDYISRIEGFCGQAITSLAFDKFGRAVVGFALVGIPAAIVNAGLKYMQKQIELSFQQRLGLTLHGAYTRNRAYYAASTLGGLTHADQRITEDVERFSSSLSELYNHSVKPALDVILFTRSLSRVMGYKGQFALYGYYLATAWLLRALSPPLAQMGASEAALSGGYRAAHQRLVAAAEEVAFNEPAAGASERLILDQHLRRLVRFGRLSSLQRFLQQIADGYLVKYGASCVALLVYAAPIYFQDPAARGDQGALTGDYIRSMRLLQNTSRGVGDLILVYKRVASLAGHTARVAELLEQVDALSREDLEHRELFRRNVSATHLLEIEPRDGAGSPPPSPRRSISEDDNIRFDRVSLNSPDGSPLIRELTFEVARGVSVLLMGPNGCGKSSLFRVMAGLWPLQAGEISLPRPGAVFYLSQRPYLVSGSLRDQLLYPYPPAAVWGATEPGAQSHYIAATGSTPPELTPELDQELAACLDAVDLGYLLQRGQGWDTLQAWPETLSGGEKQRLAMARLLFHRPLYAVLDECTSAVSADGEVRLYEACAAAGITLLSIAHRPALKRFHSLVVHFDGNVSGNSKGWWIEPVDQRQAGGQQQQQQQQQAPRLQALPGGVCPVGDADAAAPGTKAKKGL